MHCEVGTSEEGSGMCCRATVYGTRVLLESGICVTGPVILAVTTMHPCDAIEKAIAVPQQT
jgi:hypothetical protein